jgi:FkbM family methyltransferase
MQDLQGFFFRDFANSYITNILTELYKDRVYAPYFEGRKDMTVIDCGANIGLVTYYMYPYAKQIFSLEPSKRHFEALEKMIEFNKMGRVLPLNIAIAPKSGTTEFYHNENVTMFSMKKEVNSLPDDSETVTTMDFATLFTTYDIDHVDFLKLDIEGSEGDVLMSEGFAKVAPKIHTMIYEWHQWSGVNPIMLNNMLKDYGFTVKQIPSDATIFACER